MTNSLRERRQKMLKDEIIDAAQQLMADKGYVAMSVDDLAAHVGISKPTLYSYFSGGKDEIVVAAISAGMEQVIEAMQMASKDGSPLQRLLYFLRTVNRMQLTHAGNMMRIVTPELVHLLRSNDRCHAAFCQIDALIYELVQEAQQIGEIDPLLNATAVARAFGALASAQKFAHFSQLPALDPDLMIHTLVTMFERGVRKPV